MDAENRSRIENSVSVLAVLCCCGSYVSCSCSFVAVVLVLYSCCVKPFVSVVQLCYS